jgi:hypothetical protein
MSDVSFDLNGKTYLVPACPYCVPCEDEEDMITGVLDRVRKHIHSLCYDHGIRLDEE